MHKRALSFLSWGKWGGKLTFIWMRVEWLILRMCIPRAYFLEVHYPTWVWRKHWNHTEPERQQIEQESLGPVVLQERFTPSLMGSNKSSSFVPPLLALYLITSGSQVLGIHPGTAPPPCVIWDFLQHSCAFNNVQVWFLSGSSTERDVADSTRAWRRCLFYTNLGKKRGLHEFKTLRVKLKWCLHETEGLEPSSGVCLSVWGALSSDLEEFCCIPLGVVVSVELQIHLPQFCLASLRGAPSIRWQKTTIFPAF